MLLDHMHLFTRWHSVLHTLALACRIEDGTFDSNCAERQIQASNLSVSAVQDCMGSSDADIDHPLLKVTCNDF